MYICTKSNFNLKYRNEYLKFVLAHMHMHEVLISYNRPYEVANSGRLPYLCVPMIATQ